MLSLAIICWYLCIEFCRLPMNACPSPSPSRFIPSSSCIRFILSHLHSHPISFFQIHYQTSRSIDRRHQLQSTLPCLYRLLCIVCAISFSSSTKRIPPLQSRSRSPIMTCHMHQSLFCFVLSPFDDQRSEFSAFKATSIDTLAVLLDIKAAFGIMAIDNRRAIV